MTAWRSDEFRATNKLRWGWRPRPDQQQGVPALQQWWELPGDDTDFREPRPGEWRDVPTEPSQ